MVAPMRSAGISLSTAAVPGHTPTDHSAVSQLAYYNTEREHQSLARLTPVEAWNATR